MLNRHGRASLAQRLKAMPRILRKLYWVARKDGLNHGPALRFATGRSN